MVRIDCPEPDTFAALYRLPATASCDFAPLFRGEKPIAVERLAEFLLGADRACAATWDLPGCRATKLRGAIDELIENPPLTSAAMTEALTQFAGIVADAEKASATEADKDAEAERVRALFAA